MELFDVIRASLVAVYLLLGLVLACLLVAGLALGFQPVIFGIAHIAAALMLLTLGTLAAGYVMVACYAYPDGRACAQSTTSFLAVPVLLSAQVLIGLGSLRPKLPFMRWLKRLGVLIAVFGSSLPVYGCYGPVENVPPPSAARR